MAENRSLADLSNVYLFDLSAAITSILGPMYSNGGEKQEPTADAALTLIKDALSQFELELGGLSG
jgi:hypothetical protein